MKSEVYTVWRDQKLDTTALTLSKHSINAMKLLISSHKMMTSQQIALALNLNQHNVYRVMRPLVALGMVRSGKLFRKVYVAVPENYACSAYVGHARRQFGAMFGEAYAEVRGRHKGMIQ
jgi:sugar-specific transcriptional regulator TrmB